MVSVDPKVRTSITFDKGERMETFARRMGDQRRVNFGITYHNWWFGLAVWRLGVGSHLPSARRRVQIPTPPIQTTSSGFDIRVPPKISRDMEACEVLALCGHKLLSMTVMGLVCGRKW